MTSMAHASDTSHLRGAFGRGVYSATEALRLVNFQRGEPADRHAVARQTVGRWLRGYDFTVDGKIRHMPPLWKADYDAGDETDFEISFRDLIELRFVKAFRDYGLSLQTIRSCLEKAAEEVRDPRPFSTQRFRTDGKTIFLEITEGLEDPKLLDLKHRQNVFRAIVAPSFKDLEFDAEAVARWYPLGKPSSSIVVDPRFSFGRPIAGYGVPTEIIRDAILAEGSEKRVASLYDLPLAVVAEAALFERQLAA